MYLPVGNGATAAGGGTNDDGGERWSDRATPRYRSAGVLVIRTAVGRLRVVSVVEGISFAALVFVAMPLKYLADVPEPVFTLGVLHGVLYVAFVVALGQVVIDDQWTYRRTFVAVVLSVLPLGAFVLERRLRSGS